MRLPPLYMLQKCCKNVAKALTQSKNFLWRVFPFAAKSMPGILQPCLVHSCMQLDQKLFEEALPFRTKKHAWYTATMPGTRREPKGTQEERETEGTERDTVKQLFVEGLPWGITLSTESPSDNHHHATSQPKGKEGRRKGGRKKEEEQKEERRKKEEGGLNTACCVNKKFERMKK